MSTNLLLSRRRAIMKNVGGGEEEGLFAYWDGADALVDGKWVDRINGLEITLSSGVTSSGEKTFTDKNQYGRLAQNIDDFLEYELRCEIKFDFTLTDTSSSVTGVKIIDFGSMGTSTWDYAFYMAYNTDGKIHLSAKTSSNTSLDYTAAYSDTYTKNSWVYNNVAVCGIRVNGTHQEVYASINNSQESVTTGDLEIKKLKPRGVQNNTGSIFYVGGYGYISGTSRSETVTIKSIKLYSQ